MQPVSVLVDRELDFEFFGIDFNRAVVAAADLGGRRLVGLPGSGLSRLGPGEPGGGEQTHEKDGEGPVAFHQLPVYTADWLTSGIGCVTSSRSDKCVATA